LSDKSAGLHQIGNQFHEDCDEKFSSYLPSLAARPAEMRLKDRALEAFPNEQDYRPVSHFVIDQEEGDMDDKEDTIEIALGNMRGNIRPFGRESTADLDWKLEEMRRHKEELEMKVGERMVGLPESKSSAAAIAEGNRVEGLLR
jgi:hypothetical protein